jgi:hypothetical protein
MLLPRSGHRKCSPRARASFSGGSQSPPTRMDAALVVVMISSQTATVLRRLMAMPVGRTFGQPPLEEDESERLGTLVDPERHQGELVHIHKPLISEFEVWDDLQGEKAEGHQWIAEF